MIDSHGRNINYLRVSLTERCNLRCIYCMPEECSGQGLIRDNFKEEEVIEIVKAASVLGINKIRYTGGEPLLYKELDKLIYDTSRLSGIHKVGITTNGILLSDRIHELKQSGLGSVNISLDSLDIERYKQITRGGVLYKVLLSIDQCISLGIPVKINTVLLKGINDEEVWQLMDLTRELPVEVRFIELMPFGEGIKLYKERKMTTDAIQSACPQLIPVNTEKGSTARIYKLPGAKGKIGFINPLSNQFCSDCNKIRLTSTGAIKPCLHSREEIDIREYVADPAALTEIIGDAILQKPSRHLMKEEEKSRSLRFMYQIGG